MQSRNLDLIIQYLINHPSINQLVSFSPGHEQVGVLWCRKPDMKPVAIVETSSNQWQGDAYQIKTTCNLAYQHYNSTTSGTEAHTKLYLQQLLLKPRQLCLVKTGLCSIFHELPLTCGGGPELWRSPHDVWALHCTVPWRALLYWASEAPQGWRGEGTVQVGSERCRQGALRASSNGAGKDWSWSFHQHVGPRRHQVFCAWGYFKNKRTKCINIHLY